MANFEFESNDTLGTANTGVFGVLNGGQLNSISDVDLFRFTLTQGALLGIKFTLPSGATNNSFTIRVLDSGGNPIFSNAAGANFADISFSAAAGDYYFEVTANAGTTDGVSNLTLFTTEQYGITVTTLPSVNAVGEGPNNGTAVNATDIDLGQGTPLVYQVDTALVIGNLTDIADKDYFTFNSTETGVFQFKFKAPTDATPDVVITDPTNPAVDPDGTIKEFFKISILDENENVLITHYVSATPTEGYTFDFALDGTLNPTGNYFVLIENGGSVVNINTQQYNFEINPVEPSELNSTQVIGGGLTDYLLGTSTSDIILGNAGNDIIVGMAGSDSLDGGLGNDTMKGGLGNDIYMVNVAADLVIENAGQGNDKVISSVSYTLNGNVENLVLAAAVQNIQGALVGAANGAGNALNNVIVGNELGNTLSGLAGDDSLDGGLGVKGDVLIGGTGNDTYYINNKLDKIVESAGAVGGVADRVYAKVDVMALGTNVENLQLLEVGFNDDGSSLATYGVGNTSANEIIGNSASNQLSGLAGNDTIFGGAGNDALIGGLGNDALVGGSGSDMFVFEKALSATTNVDTIFDFESGLDAINLSKLIFTKLVGLPGNSYVGELSVDNFHVGATAADATDYIIYDSTTGNLFYDKDGNLAGAQVLFANVGASTTLEYTDFTVL